MMVTVKIGEKTYNVQIEDLNARPIVAIVEGQRFEVMPENGLSSAPPARQTLPQPGAAPAPALAALSSPGSVGSLSGNTLIAPLPGTVTSIFVKPGDSIETGQVLLVIEAMKMKNSIRATRSGVIAEVLINEGQTVAHKQPLLTFVAPGEAAWI